MTIDNSAIYVGLPPLPVPSTKPCASEPGATIVKTFCNKKCISEDI